MLYFIIYYYGSYCSSSIFVFCYNVSIDSIVSVNGGFIGKFVWVNNFFILSWRGC